MISLQIITIILQVLFIPLFSPLLIGIIRKIKARLQNREGASILQPYFDILKLFRKDEVISGDASWIFRVAPFIVFGVTMLIGASIPIFSLVTTYIPSGDFLVIMYLFVLGTFFLALAGMDTGSGFGGFGSSREMIAALWKEASLFAAHSVDRRRDDQCGWYGGGIAVFFFDTALADIHCIPRFLYRAFGREFPFPGG
jgi:formate hydrogenlyase subunit 4